jgi:hypothetical protein
MRARVAEHINSLIDEVKGVEIDSEGSYLSFGRLLASISSEMERSSRNARASLDEFTRTTGGSSETGFRSIAGFARESSAYFATVHDRDVAFLARINESIDRLSTLEDVIGRVRSDSEEMEIISLNAMTVALKSGNAGKAFSVITDELKRLSTRTISLTETITTRGRELKECFGVLRDALGELDAFQDGFFGRLDEALTKGFSSLENGIKDSAGVFADLLGEAMSVRDPVQSIMQSVQLQDIIRQSLQHVTISLVEAEKAAMDAERRESTAVDYLDEEGAEAAPREAPAVGSGAGEAGLEDFAGSNMEEDLAFVSAIMRLVDSLIEDVVGKLDASGLSFASSLEAIEFIVGNVERKRSDQAKALEAATSGTGSDTANYLEGSAHYLGLKKQVVQTARRLSEQVKGLDESFRGLAGLLSRFQNIVIASRIEVAKNKSLSGVANTVQGMVQLTERLGADVGEAMDTTKTFIKVAYGAIAEYAGSEDARRASEGSMASGVGSAAFEAAAQENDRLVATLERVEANLKILDGARMRVGENLGSFLLYTPEFIDLISEARSVLSGLEGLSARLKRIQGELTALKGELVDAEGTVIEEASIRSERLRAMIDRFTIFTHKRTAGEIGRFDVEDGAESGEITLF